MLELNRCINEDWKRDTFGRAAVIDKIAYKQPLNYKFRPNLTLLVRKPFIVLSRYYFHAVVWKCH